PLSNDGRAFGVSLAAVAIVQAARLAAASTLVCNAPWCAADPVASASAGQSASTVNTNTPPPIPTGAPSTMSAASTPAAAATMPPLAGVTVTESLKASVYRALSNYPQRWL